MGIPPVSPFLIKITKGKVNEIKKAVKFLYHTAHRKSQLKQIETKQRAFLNSPAPDSSLLMSYDFHISSKGKLKLIEINTNSSGYLISDLVDQIQKTVLYQKNQHNNTPLQTYKKGTQNLQTNTQKADKTGKPQQTAKNPGLLYLKQSFEHEWKLFSGQDSPPPEILIIDHKIKSQKMYMEFLMYQDWLNSWGRPCRLYEAGDLQINPKGMLTDTQKKPVYMIYNRLTDFYFERFPNLKSVFLNQKTCISPHPREYLLLADKTRLREWSSKDLNTTLTAQEQSYLQQIIPFTAFVNSLPIEELWKKRKSLFFKPLTGYGGKSVYRGKNISRRVFNRMVKEPGLVQETVPPPVFKDQSGQEWKYDIRAYAYRDQVQKLSARVYQGQLTQFQKPLSGFASLITE